MIMWNPSVCDVYLDEFTVLVLYVVCCVLQFKCCGFETYEDYSKKNADFSCVSDKPQACGVPYSCCKQTRVSFSFISRGRASTHGAMGHRIDPSWWTHYLSFHPVHQDWCNKGCGMSYPVWDGAYKRTLVAN